MAAAAAATDAAPAARRTRITPTSNTPPLPGGVDEKDQNQERCKECRRDLGLGVDVVIMQHGVIGPRGFVPLDEHEFFCDEDCLERFLNGEEVVKLPRRIP